MAAALSSVTSREWSEGLRCILPSGIGNSSISFRFVSLVIYDIMTVEYEHPNELARRYPSTRDGFAKRLLQTLDIIEIMQYCLYLISIANNFLDLI